MHEEIHDLNLENFHCTFHKNGRDGEAKTDDDKFIHANLN